jgi:hypothetical protein
MTHARIVGGVVAEVIDFDPEGRFTPEIAELFVPVPDGTEQGATDDGDGTFTPPPPPPDPPPAPPPILTAADLDPEDHTFEGATTWLS